MAGWRVVGRLPDLDQFVLIGAPHTTNWDFLLFLWVRAELQMSPRFLGKHTIFWWPLGILWRAIGGIPVERGARLNVVDQVVARFRETPRMILVISPEGTRKYTAAWKSGFYHIARRAGVPIVPGRIDYPARTITLGSPQFMTGDAAEDIRFFREFYASARGYRPEKASAIELDLGELSRVKSGT